MSFLDLRNLFYLTHILQSKIGLGIGRNAFQSCFNLTEIVIPESVMNIPAAEYRQSGEMETAVPAFWVPTFRRNGNRCPVGACIRC